jgi:hypothetical protein
LLQLWSQKHQHHAQLFFFIFPVDIMTSNGRRPRSLSPSVGTPASQTQIPILQPQHTKESAPYTAPHTVSTFVVRRQPSPIPASQIASQLPDEGCPQHVSHPFHQHIQHQESSTRFPQLLLAFNNPPSARPFSTFPGTTYPDLTPHHL